MSSICHPYVTPDIVEEVFLVKEQVNYNLRNQKDFVIPHVKSVNYCSERKHTGFRTKNMGKSNNDLKNKESVDSFKAAAKRSKLCLCRLCKTYLPNIGYL